MSNVFSDIQIWPIKTEKGTLLASGKVTVYGTISLRFQVIKGSNGPFASLPARKGTVKDESGKEKWYPEVRILDDALYEEFQKVVKEAYNSNGQGKSTAVNDGVPF
jgi:DNA-binding cell septation regulator SpoVG